MVSREEAELNALAREKAEKEAAWEVRHKERLRNHTIAGAVLFFGFNLVLQFMAGSSLGWILVGAVLMALVGAGAGFIISWRNHGRFGGAAVGAGLFTVFILVLGAVFGTLGNINIFILFASSLLCGGIPGFFIGFHVETDI